MINGIEEGMVKGAEGLQNPHPASVRQETDLRKELQAAKDDLQSAKDQLLYALAEAENMRTRTRQEIDKARLFALEPFAQALLPVVDALEKAVVSDGAEGVKLALQMFQRAFEKFGVQVVDPLNQQFDPRFHEALSAKEESDVKPDTVLEVLQKGYLLNRRLIRPALVVVSKKPAPVAQ